MPFRLSNLVMLAAIGSSLGCATGVVSPLSLASPGPSSRQTVSAAELSRDGRNDTVLGALRRVRPEFLNVRGSAVPAVSIDGGPLMDLSILETMRVSTIVDVRLERSSLGHSRTTPSGAVVVGADVLQVRLHHHTPAPDGAAFDARQ